MNVAVHRAVDYDSASSVAGCLPPSPSFLVTNNRYVGLVSHTSSGDLSLMASAVVVLFTGASRGQYRSVPS